MLRATALLAFALAFTACESDSPVTGVTPASVERVAGDAQAGVRLQALPIPLSVRVVDDRGRPVPNATVIWSTTVRASTITPAQAVTDMQGIASALWTLGELVGEQKALATVEGVGVPVEFIATSRLGPPVRLQMAAERRMPEGDTTQLEFSAEYAGAPQPLLVYRPQGTWSTSNPAVATVEGGRVRAVAVGTAYIRLTVDGVSDSTRVQVLPVLLASAAAVRGNFRDFEACALNEQGQIVCWGTLEGRRAKVPTPVPGSTRFASLSMHLSHACALDLDGGAWCWGENGFGQLGTGGTAAASAPTPVAGGLRFTQIVVGDAGTCGLTPEGEAYCWGLNDHGQVGDGTTTTRTAPARVASPAAFTMLTVGGKTVCGLTAAGQAYCWGARAHSSRTPVPVFGGARYVHIDLGEYYTCSVDSEGRAGCGSALFGDTPFSLTDTQLRFTSISVGAGFQCGITPTREAYCWGDGEWGQLGDGVRHNSYSNSPGARVSTDLPLRSIDANASAACANAVSGQVLCWGRQDELFDTVEATRICGPRGAEDFCRVRPRIAVRSDR